jgi:tRNA (guanine37-N1)-methyltransferase
MESLCIRVPKKEGEKTRKKLTEIGVIDKNFKIRPEKDHLLIPVVRPVDGYDIENADFDLQKIELSPAENLGYTPAYEQIGEIIIIDRHEQKAQDIAEILLHRKNIRTVLQAETSISGEYRTREISFLAGERNTETLYKENNCRYLIDLARVYFTPRLSTERMRIADQIKNGDTVVDMFAGVGPFSILIAKRYPSSRVIAIDKNTAAIYYLKENVKLNKVKNIEIWEGDARDIAGAISGADHVIMNLPHSGLEFLDAALSMVKSNGVIHFYAIAHKDDLFEGTLKEIEEIAGNYGFKVDLLHKRIVRPYAPYQYNICIDVQVV